MQPIIRPPALSLGDTLGIVAPSLPLFPSMQPSFQTGIDRLHRWGFQTRIGESCATAHWWASGRPQAVAADINRMYSDPTVKGIVATSGGFSAVGVIEYLDYELIAAHPKPFLGMSDNTIIHLAMLAKTGLIGFHGNDVTEGFGPFWAERSEAQQEQIKQTYLNWLTDPEPLGELPEVGHRESWVDGTAAGRLIGGTLRRIVGLAGTPYFPAEYFDGGILFFEEIGETLYGISRNLIHLKHMGVLEKLSGVIVGEPTWVNQFFDEIEHPSSKEAICEILAPYNIPIIHSDEFGHRRSMLPVPLGCRVKIDTKTNSIAILESSTYAQ